MPTYKRGSYTGRHNNKNHTDTNNSVKIQRKIYCEHMVKTAKEQRKLQKEEGKESMPTPLQDVVIWALTSVLISRDFVLTEEYFYDPQYQETGIMTVTKCDKINVTFYRNRHTSFRSSELASSTT